MPYEIPGKRLIAIAVGAAVLGAAIMASYLYADRTPAPHDVRVDVVGPAAAVSHVRSGLDHAMPGGFDVRSRATVAEARADLHRQDAVGALVTATSAGAPDRVLTAGAAGTSLKQPVMAALTAAAKAGGHPVAVIDEVPLPDGDRGGISVFVLMLALLIPSVIGGVGLYLVGQRARLWWRVGAATLFAVLIGAAAALIADLGLGALTGAWPALLGISALGAASFALVVAAAQATFGLPGTGLAAIVLIFLGSPTSGGTVPTQLLPDGYRELSPWLPNGAVVHALRSAVYFDGNGIGQPLLTLVVWLAGAAVVLLANDLAHVRLRRVEPHRAAQIHATPGIAHAARWVRRERYHGSHEVSGAAV